VPVSRPDEPAPIRQAAAIPFRRQRGHVEFCLITSIKGRRWIFPKGIVDEGETPKQTALKEVLEEAGLHGRILGESLGSYRYAKWGTTLTVEVYLMEVASTDADWAEREQRQRRWVDADAARRLLCRENDRDLLERAIDRLRS
jgi:phosphohistidine phosphatase